MVTVAAAAVKTLVMVFIDVASRKKVVRTVSCAGHSAAPAGLGSGHRAWTYAGFRAFSTVRVLI
jgi:hypothetical protein